MEKELGQVTHILDKAYDKIDKLDLRCKSSVLTACYLEQMQRAMASVLDQFPKAENPERYENTLFAISKVVKNSIEQYIPWQDFLRHCATVDVLDKYLQFANNLEEAKSLRDGV